MAGYVIHTAVGLSAMGEERVAELNLMEVLADGSPAELAERADFSVVACDDVTAEFHRTSAAILRARAKHEAELRTVDGDAAYQDDQQRKETLLGAIEDGLIERSSIALLKN